MAKSTCSLEPIATTLLHPQVRHTCSHHGKDAAILTCLFSRLWFAGESRNVRSKSDRVAAMQTTPIRTKRAAAETLLRLASFWASFGSMVIVLSCSLSLLFCASMVDIAGAFVFFCHLRVVARFITERVDSLKLTKETYLIQFSLLISCHFDFCSCSIPNIVMPPFDTCVRVYSYCSTSASIDTYACIHTYLPTYINTRTQTHTHTQMDR